METDMPGENLLQLEPLLKNGTPDEKRNYGIVERKTPAVDINDNKQKAPRILSSEIEHKILDYLPLHNTVYRVTKNSIFSKPWEDKKRKGYIHNRLKTQGRKELEKETKQLSLMREKWKKLQSEEKASKNGIDKARSTLWWFAPR